MDSAKPRPRLIPVGVVTAIAYVVAAQVGFRFAIVAEQVTTVWAPTGIGMAALLLWGTSLWPAIWIGAFVANAGTDAPLWTAGAVATGNTLEAVVAAWALRRGGHFNPRLQRVRDVLAFIVIGALASTAVSATIGVTALSLSGAQPWERFDELWRDWWIGDAVGALVVAPVLLTVRRERPWTRRDGVEGGLLVGGAVAALQIVFGGMSATAAHRPLEYVVFPFVIAAAVRRGQPVTSLVVLAGSAVTIWHTARGLGPYAGGPVHDSLVLLQVFMGVLAGTGLLLAAATAERETGERRRGAAAAAGDVLSRASDLAAAAPAILRGICENLGWQMGALWLFDPDERRLHCAAIWSDGMRPAFETATRTEVFEPGVGLPGRVLSSGKPAWIETVLADDNFTRAAAAREAGLQTAFGFPIALGDEVLGVIECFHRVVVPPDTDLLRTMSTLGYQIGQFIGRKREEEAIAEEQRLTSAIVNTALDAVITMNAAGVITEFNPAAVRIFGHSRDAAVGHDLADLLIPAAARSPHRAGLARFLTTGHGAFLDRRVETVARHADGHEFPVEVAITRIADAEPPVFTGFVRDLTARVRAEREREQLLTSEATARTEAEAANRAKDEFLATLSHELRTPLNAIVGWTRLLLDGSVDPGSTRHALEVIDRNAQLQAKLVGDILDVSRIITGGLNLELRPVDLGTVIGAALDAVRPAATARQVRLVSRLAAPTRVVQGDPQRLQQVVWNLLANAVKFTPEGGTVGVDLLDAGSAVQIRVHDDGAGIDPEFLPYVFDRFRQADGGISRQHGGLGLGLAIVRHLVELHGGRVAASSPGRGKGATFTVELPVAVDDAISPEFGLVSSGPSPLEVASGDALRGYRLLVVDDHDDARELIATMLTNAGGQVVTAGSAAEALDKLASARPDAMVADIGMPGADGYALIREVRKRDAQWGARLPAAAVTAYAGDVDRERAIAAGFDYHLAKPISQSAIVSIALSMCARTPFP